LVGVRRFARRLPGRKSDEVIRGLLGAILRGWAFGLLGLAGGNGLSGSILAAFVGAVILIGITRLVKRA
jgi:uncharacterized membrane protein YeaQ/YmgE (transglycosylase-associated protein family)